MNSRFILHGGSNYPNTLSNFRYWREFSRFEKLDINVLSIAFACANVTFESGITNHEAAAISLQDNLSFVNPDKRFYVATATEEKIVEQIGDADVIYVHGGDGDLLQYTLKDVNLKPLRKAGKIIGGASAGTNMWSKTYFSNDNQAVCEGFGVLPIKTFCHYETGKWRALNALIRSTGDMPVITLGDGDYVVI